MAAALGAWGLAGAATAEERAGADLPDDAPSVFLQFVDRSGEESERIAFPPHLILRIGSGDPRRAIMDTGSTGIVVSATAIPADAGAADLGPGRLTYTSSGRVMVGRWVSVAVEISGTAGAAIVTRSVPVLAVERIACLEHARSCEPNDAPRNVAMVGIGFAREHDRQPLGTPDKNPFLNVVEIVSRDGGTRAAVGQGAAMRRGYVVDRRGVRIGLTKRAAEGFSLVELTRNPAGTDWSAVPMCVTVGGAAPACGSLLTDTGVIDMFLTAPAASDLAAAAKAAPAGEGTFAGTVSEGTASAMAGSKRVASRRAGERGAKERGAQPPAHLPAGIPVQVAFGATAAEPGRAAATFSFRTGDRRDEAAPERVIVVGDRSMPPFVNTGVHVLNRFDILFDADGGRVGYRPVVHE